MIDSEGFPAEYKAEATAGAAFLDRLLGEQVRADGACGVDLWCALTNTRWFGPDGVEVSYGFRRAGHAVAWVREEGDDLTWYCSGEPGQVVAGEQLG